MTKKDSRRSGHDHALVSQSMVCLPGRESTQHGDGGHQDGMVVLRADELREALESSSMVTLTDRVESWLRLTGSKDQESKQPIDLLPKPSQGMGQSGTRRARPGRHRSRPVWNQSTCITPKPHNVSQLPILPVHGHSCSCVGCERIKKSRHTQQNDLSSSSKKRLTLPAIGLSGGQSKKHVRSSTFPATISDQQKLWPPQQQHHRQHGSTQSQLVTGNRTSVHDHDRFMRHLPGIPESQLTKSMGPITDRQAELLSWASDNKKPPAAVTGMPQGPDDVRLIATGTHGPMFTRPSNRPVTVQKPVVGARFPKQPATLPPIEPLAQAHGKDDSIPKPNTIQQLSSHKQTPSVCLRTEKAKQQTVDEQEGRTPTDYGDAESMDSFRSDSLSSHGLELYSDDEEDEYFDVSDLVTAAQSPCEAPAKDTDVLQQHGLKLQEHKQDEGLASGFPVRRARKEELQDLQQFAEWAERFGGGMKGMSIASLMQDCREARHDDHHGDMSSRNKPSVTARRAAQNVERKLSQKQENQQKLREIERIRKELISMRQRHALQQQEAAIQQEVRRSMIFQAVGEPITTCEDQACKLSTHTDTVSVEDSVSLGIM
ncbi:uncharacterized protein LOC135817075 isoform X1 [Sycon ciliatum]|uniref:uncharacterized protein LOC135817075 isoform X1 n=1 Tax=Sycon ciliatum TaxID=27933 RepID=UPI0031F6A9AE